ncbi:TIGR03667 family PPOX class F420-dependent oxidoreductase [Actinospica sp. MGRD01-02]|uniref:TIGR03667 family PPOX class F420-dependent oxidoreductase n=1 Tax=Actinospica acidithermotolerans TaxID=2828514 RepID=A0A941IKZ7_9ACTN|nr:TIGR03667 family PPOX class F420-dependent oxidoreductase [Actinospica acidithermotolerans]MBR7831164.1 TIGR03667 family PPOX class F420-dependent oxidoreductase [Actinospica acidithermotolerans]
MTGTHALPDPATPFGRTVRERLRDEPIIWLTTVAASGTPQPNPVWFLWQPDPDDAWGEGSFLIYHDNTAARLRTLAERPRVSLNFNSTAGGGGITVFTGDVEILEGHPPAHEVPGYAAKYGPRVAALGADRDLAAFMARYSIATRIRPDRVRGF